MPNGTQRDPNTGLVYGWIDWPEAGVFANDDGSVSIRDESGNDILQSTPFDENTTIIASGGNNHYTPAYLYGSSSNTQWQSRQYFKAQFTSARIRFRFSSYYATPTNPNVGELPGGTFWITCGPARKGASYTDQTPVPEKGYFNSKRYVRVTSREEAVTDWIAFPVVRNEELYLYTEAEVGLLPNPDLTSTLPTAGGTGGTIPTATYSIKVTYVAPQRPDGGPDESIPNTASTLLAVTLGQQITLPSISAPAGQLYTGIRVYMSRANASSGNIDHYLVASLPFGAAYTWGTLPPDTAPPPPGILPLGKLADNSLGEFMRLTVATTTRPSDGGAGPTTTAQAIYCAQSMEGQPTEAPLSCYIEGTSEVFGIGDGGLPYGLGGYAIRALIAEGVPFATGAKGGETLTSWLTNSSARNRQRMSAGFVIGEHGTNDTSLDLATLQIRMLKDARRSTRRKQFYIRPTILPRTDSTDDWLTVANQTFPIAGWETVRTNACDWIISPSTVGSSMSETLSGTVNGSNKSFLASRCFAINPPPIVTTATGATTDFTYVESDGVYANGVVLGTAPASGTVTLVGASVPGFEAAVGPYGVSCDICAPIEVNSSGVLAHNGGRWNPNSASVVATDTITAAAADSGLANSILYIMTLTASGASWPTFSAGSYVKVNANRLPISSNTATTMRILGNTSSGTGTGTVISGAVTIDGIHMTSIGHILVMAQIRTAIQRARRLMTGSAT